MDGQGTTWHRNIAENFNRLSRVHERYRQTTDGQTMTYSEHELEFTFAKNHQITSQLIVDVRFHTEQLTIGQRLLERGVPPGLVA